MILKTVHLQVILDTPPLKERWNLKIFMTFQFGVMHMTLAQPIYKQMTIWVCQNKDF